MSDNSFKSKARRHQKSTGTSYMRARREVDRRGDTGEAGDVPALADAAQMLSVLGLGEASVDDIAALWAARELPVGTDERVNLGPLLRVPLGLGADGVPVWLDLKESADEGAGPHVLQVGKTGSGKSTVLRSMLAGLCAQHSPDLLQLVLVEAKSGEFEDFAGYPHTAAVLGPAAVMGPDDCGVALIELREERARALAAAGVAHIRHYRELRASAEGADLPSLPTVVVVVDEFPVLQRTVAGCADVLDTLLRTGRSLGIHVVAVGQRGAGGSLINSRIVLRTLTAEDSHQVLGNADAHELPTGVGMYSPEPGAQAERFRGFLIPNELIRDLGRRFAAAAAGPE